MTCKDCLYYEVCADFRRNICETDQKRFEEYRLNSDGLCDNFKDKSRYVELLCKVGDTVYIIDNRDMLDVDPSVCSVVEDEIYEMGYGRTQSGELKWLFLVYETGEDFYDDEIGKFVFLTREEAEKALAERAGNGN